MNWSDNITTLGLLGAFVILVLTIFVMGAKLKAKIVAKAGMELASKQITFLLAGLLAF